MTETGQRNFFIAKTLTNDISLFPHYVLRINLHKEFLTKKERNINIREMRHFRTKTDTVTWMLRNSLTAAYNKKETK